MDWKRILDFTKTEVLGLDIGSSAVKVVRLRKDDGGYAVTAAGFAEIAPTTSFCEVNGGGEEDNNHQNTIKAIRECFESVGRKTKLAVCGISGPEVAVRDFVFPLLSTEEIDGAVSFEATQVCPFNAADSAVDYHLIPNGDDKTRGILVAATNALIKSKVQLTKETALKCVLMDVDGLALLNCFNGLTDESKRSTTAILNVGGSGTTVAIMGGNGRPFVRDMTFGGDNIIKQIAADKGISTEDIKGILFGDSTAVQMELHNNFEKACQRLIVDVSETLRYYATQEQSTPVEKIFVCGGFALVRGFVELLNRRLGVEAVLWNPFEKIRCDAGQQFGDIVDKRGPALAVAAGLAMRSV
ncbi:MAG: type IV pilus assembly protein PilM [Planctomycetes bacterium]|nr:type IV pilus assembly protein PilM [Planctomycetota bacterium]